MRILMMKLIVFGVTMFAAGAAGAENLVGVDEMICSTAQAQVCLEDGDCYSAVPWELAIPDFVVINTKKNTISTTSQRRKPLDEIQQGGKNGRPDLPAGH